MSTIVPMPVRVKPPPADTGEIISPGCASFEIATPSNGARTAMSARSVCRRLTRLSATSICCCATAMRALSDSTSAARRSSSALPIDLLLDELLAAAERQLRFAQPRFVFRGAAARRLELRLARPPALPATCESSSLRQHLPLFDRLAFLDEHFEHFAGDLRRDRRPPPRRHVARGVQHGARRGAAAGLRRRPTAVLTGDRLQRGSTSTQPAAAEHDERRARRRSTRPRRLLPARARLIDTQRGEVVFEIRHSSPATLIVDD